MKIISNIDQTVEADMSTHRPSTIAVLGILSYFLWASSVPADDAWFVDTRHATLRSQGETIEHLDVARLERDGRNRSRWASATPDEFLETHDPNLPLVIVIHGNWMTYPEAKSHGIAFHRLSEKLGPHRLLIWSWPSERVECGIRRDALLKARRADVQARFLAVALRKLAPGSKVSLVGFSFGSKLACETLQLLAAENGHELRIRCVLLAAAMDRQSLIPGRQYGSALSATEKMLVHVNPKDSTLRWYPLLKGRKGPQAVGKEGVSMAGMPAEYAEKIRTRNVQRMIGADHGFMASLLAFAACRDDFRHDALFLD